MKDIEKIREGLYVKKSKLGGFKVVHPIKNDDGTTNWFNVLTGGSWANLIKVIGIVLMILVLCYGYYHDVKTCRELLSNPCKFLPNITSYCYSLSEFESPMGLYNITIREDNQSEK